MVRVLVVVSSKACRRLVLNLLQDPHARPLAVATRLVQRQHDTPGTLALLQIATWDGPVYLFDVQANRDLLYEGQLWRLLHSQEIIKVMHDCRQASTVLRTQFQITLQGIFDTQAAYSLLLMQQGLPARKLPVAALHQKYASPAQQHHVQESGDETGLFWARRPLSQQMMQCAASEVQMLVPTVYEALKREIGSGPEGLLNELCSAYIHGTFSSKQSAKQKDGPARTSHKQPITKLTEAQKKLLEHTIPLTAM